MEFYIPETAKSVAANTAKTYNRHLNKIAAISGVNTIDKVVQRPQDVVDSIKLLILMEDDETKKRASARVYYSAIFYVLFGHPYLSQPQNILRKSFHEYDPRTTAKNTPWVQLSAFKNNETK